MASSELAEARRASKDSGSSIRKSRDGDKMEGASDTMNDLPVPNVATSTTKKFWQELGAHDGLETKRGMKSRHLVMIGALIVLVSFVNPLSNMLRSYWRHDWHWYFFERWFGVWSIHSSLRRMLTPKKSRLSRLPVQGVRSSPIL